MLAGYLAAWGGTAAGHGWRLAPHIALEHAGVPTLPDVVAGGQAHRVLPTLRPTGTHAHGGHKHTHGGHAHSHESEFARPAGGAFPAGRAAQAHDDHPLHEHDGVFHSHDAPTPAPAVAATVALDKHRLPTTPDVPAPPASTLADLGDGAGPPESIDSSVETPPPIRRG